MRVFVAALLTSLMLGVGAGNQEKTDRKIVLVDPGLIGSCPGQCSQLWQENVPTADKTYPVQVILDISQERGCLYGITALYDKSVPVRDIKAELDQRYGSFAKPGSPTSPVKLWRVEPERIAIQLAVVDEDKEAGPLKSRKQGEATADDGRDIRGKRQVIYLPFAGSQCEHR